MPIRGSCLCGGVQFEIDRAVGPVELCHCARCRKVSGSSALMTVGVRTADYRLLSGAELIRSFTAPILYAPPAYRSTFCARCGSQVPPAQPEGEQFEIAAGTFDEDPGVRPDRHIFVELAPVWMETGEDLPRCTIGELSRIRTGRELPPGFQLKRHSVPE